MSISFPLLTRQRVEPIQSDVERADHVHRCALGIGGLVAQRKAAQLLAVAAQQKSAVGHLEGVSLAQCSRVQHTAVVDAHNDAAHLSGGGGGGGVGGGGEGKKIREKVKCWRI